ncbi:hypothetical protein [Metabacillus herbersteinensis]|uniref:hypothetical protein n=1 Tax=Metabacillus herbersteinensis TaxID=283816 RepID=UPI00366FDD2C
MHIAIFQLVDKVYEIDPVYKLFLYIKDEMNILWGIVMLSKHLEDGRNKIEMVATRSISGEIKIKFCMPSVKNQLKEFLLMQKKSMVCFG